MRLMATAAPARATLIDFFHDATKRTGPFLVHDDGYRTWTFRYDEVGTAARRLAARLHAAGLVKGDAVVLWGENRPEWIVAFWACLLRGIVVVPIDYRSAPSLVDRIAAVVSARLLLIGEDVDAECRDARRASLAADDAVARGGPRIGRRRRCPACRHHR